MSPHRIGSIVRVLLLGLLVALCSGCATASSGGGMGDARYREQQVGPAGLTVAEIQSEVMSFADTYASFVSQASGDILVVAETTAIRQIAHESKLRSVTSAFVIASTPNPAIALLDMIVLVKLEREVLEALGPKYLGEHSQTLMAAYVTCDEIITRLAEKVLRPDELTQIEEMIHAWRRQHPNQWVVSHVRFDDFAAHRQITQTSAKTGGSLFTIVGLDPLAKMDPTLRQIEQSRLLGERIFYYVSRVPLLLNWQAEGLFYRLADTSEAETVLAGAERMTVVSERMVTLAESFPAELTAEREAAVTQLGEETQLAVDRLMDRVTKERKAIVADLESSRETLADVTTTLAAGTELAESLTTLVSHFPPAEPSTTPSEPVDIKDVQATVEATTVAVQNLNELVGSLDKLLASPQLSQLESALALAEGSGRRLLNRAGLLLAGLIGLVFAGIVFLRRRSATSLVTAAAPVAGVPKRPLVEIEAAAVSPAKKVRTS